MSVNGKRSEIDRSDFLSLAKEMNIKSAGRIIDDILHHVSLWGDYAKKAGLIKELLTSIQKSFKLKQYS
jgi:hypothetical protein